MVNVSTVMFVHVLINCTLFVPLVICAASDGAIVGIASFLYQFQLTLIFCLFQLLLLLYSDFSYMLLF